MRSIQKRHADFFEAYIGAAWISASQTKDPEHIREIEGYLSQLYKPRVWPALESLVNGHGGLISAVRLEQALDSGSEDEGAGDISVIDLPVVEGKKRRKFPGRIARGGKRKASGRADRLQVEASHRYHGKKQGLRENHGRMVEIPVKRPGTGHSVWRPIVL